MLTGLFSVIKVINGVPTTYLGRKNQEKIPILSKISDFKFVDIFGISCFKNEYCQILEVVNLAQFASYSILDVVFGISTFYGRHKIRIKMTGPM